MVTDLICCYKGSVLFNVPSVFLLFLSETPVFVQQKWISMIKIKCSLVLERWGCQVFVSIRARIRRALTACHRPHSCWRAKRPDLRLRWRRRRGRARLDSVWATTESCRNCPHSKVRRTSVYLQWFDWMVKSVLGYYWWILLSPAHTALITSEEKESCFRGGAIIIFWCYYRFYFFFDSVLNHYYSNRWFIRCFCN